MKKAVSPAFPFSRRVRTASGAWAALAIALAVCIPVSGQEDAPAQVEFQQSPSGHFIRVRVDREQEPVAMETSVTRYIGTNPDGEQVSVDLIGVVHVGEKEYYEALNSLFGEYDALLYELIAPEGTVIPEGGRGESEGLNPVAALQLGLKSVLGLEFQLDHVDYGADNFVHADMTPEEFLESMRKNEESFFKMAMKAVGQGLGRQSASGKNSLNEGSLMMAMLSGNRQREIRKIMAAQMQDMEAGLVIFEGKDGSTIIDHRNRKAMRILREQVGEGKRKIGVFYGAGHLPHMEELLLTEHGMKRGGQYWLEAWNLR